MKTLLLILTFALLVPVSGWAEALTFGASTVCTEACKKNIYAQQCYWECIEDMDSTKKSSKEIETFYKEKWSPFLKTTKIAFMPEPTQSGCDIPGHQLAVGDQCTCVRDGKLECITVKDDSVFELSATDETWWSCKVDKHNLVECQEEKE